MTRIEQVRLLSSSPSLMVDVRVSPLVDVVDTYNSALIFGQLADSTDPQLTEVCQSLNPLVPTKKFQGWREEASKRAQFVLENGLELTQIEGIDPDLARMLASAGGIATLAQLASATVEDIYNALGATGAMARDARITFQEWINKAKELSAK